MLRLLKRFGLLLFMLAMGLVLVTISITHLTGQSFDVRPSFKGTRSLQSPLTTSVNAMSGGQQLMLERFGDSLDSFDGMGEELDEQFAQRYGFCGCTGGIAEISGGRFTHRCGWDKSGSTYITNDLTKAYHQFWVLNGGTGDWVVMGAFSNGLSYAGMGMTGNVFEVTYRSSNGYGGFIFETNNNFGQWGSAYSTLATVVANAPASQPYETNITLRITNAAVVVTTVRCRALSNFVQIVSMGLWDNTHPGVIFNVQSRSGCSITQWNSVPTNSLGSELAAWASFPKLQWMKWVNPGSVGISNGLPAWLGTLNYWAGAGDKVIIGMHAVGFAQNEPDRVAINVAEALFAQQNGIPYFDTSAYLGTFSQGWSRGYYQSDGLHLSFRGANVSANYLWNWMNLLGDRGLSMTPPYSSIPFQLPLDAGLILAGSDDNSLNNQTNQMEFWRNGSLAGFVDLSGELWLQPSNTASYYPANHTLLTQLGAGTAATNNVQTTNSLFGTIGTGSTTLAPSYFQNTNRVSVLDISGDYYTAGSPIPWRFIGSIDGAAVNNVEGLVTPPANVVQGTWVAHLEWNILTNSASVGAYTIGGYVQFYGGAGATATLTNKTIVTDNFSTNHTIGLWSTNGPAGAAYGLVSRRAVAVLK